MPQFLLTILNSNVGRLSVGAIVFLIGSAATYYYMDRPTVEVQVAMACLVCHDGSTNGKNVLPDFEVKNTHFPFEKLLCTACHTTHGISIANAEERTTFIGFYKGKLTDWLRAVRGATADSAAGLIVVDLEDDLLDPNRESFQTGASADSLGAPEAPPVDIDLDALGVSSDARPAGLGKSEYTAAWPDICTRCHAQQAEELLKKFQMSPFNSGGCNTCHSSHGSDFPAMTKDKVPDLCWTCHGKGASVASGLGPDIKSFTDMPVQMAPFEGGDCTQCHYPHATDVPKLLKKGGVPFLCNSCHDAINVGGGTAKDWRSMPSQMAPFAAGQCMKCHVPHGSQYKRLLKQPVPDLCYSCHKAADEGGSAPDIKTQFELPSHHPVPEGKINCLNCHYPMAGPYPKLLQKPFRTNNGSCGTCHLPHGSYGTFLHAGENRKVTDGAGPNGVKTLAATPADSSVIAVCTQCHKQDVYATEDSHPVQDRFDPNAGREISCVSTCHAGLYFPDMSIFENTLCVRCHTGHNAPSTAIGSDAGRQTGLLKLSHAEIRARTWQEAWAGGITSAIVQAPHVSIETPTGKTTVSAGNLEPKALELVGKYMRLGVEDQFKIKRDRGCMLCHNVRDLP